jgi:hypothetical protein
VVKPSTPQVITLRPYYELVRLPAPSLSPRLFLTCLEFTPVAGYPKFRRRLFSPPLHGLRPRQVTARSPYRSRPCWLQNRQVLGLLRSQKYRGSFPSLALRMGGSFPPAPYGSLPPRTRGSVLTWWLAFGQVGFPTRLPQLSWRTVHFFGGRSSLANWFLFYRHLYSISSCL